MKNLLLAMLLLIACVGAAPRAHAEAGDQYWTTTVVVIEGIEYLWMTRPAYTTTGMASVMIRLGPAVAPVVAKPVVGMLPKVPLAVAAIGSAYATYLANEYRRLASQMVTPVGSDPGYNLTPYENPANWWQNTTNYWSSWYYGTGYAG